MLSSLFLLATFITMGIGAVGLFFRKKQGPSISARRWSEVPSWISLGFGVLFAVEVLFTGGADSSRYFHFDRLQAVLVPYILVMGVLVKRFAYHYIQSDKYYASFFLKIKLLMSTLLLFVVLNHCLLLLFTWVASGWIMYFLISHTKTPSSINSAKIAFNHFLIGDFFVTSGFIMLIIKTGSLYLTDWVRLSSTGQLNDVLIPLVCIVIGSFSKTALIPFHKWLAHTLTAPTPVSAIMHAGFINSGAILLTKFSPIIIHDPALMTLIFTLGFVSALFGSTVMLVQTDVKRYLTFSTVGQMGFMIMECGIGAFHLAILHLIIHGFFKARLFLSAGRVIEHRQAIRNVTLRQNEYEEERKGTSNNLHLASTILISVIATWILVLQHPFLQGYLLELPTILLSVLALSTLFIHTALMKTKGSGIKGISVSMLFSLSLIMMYISYEITAQTFLPNLSLVSQVIEISPFYSGTILLLVMGAIVWLFSLKILPLPRRLKQKCYVYLLNATGTFKNCSTFSERHQSALF